MPRCSESYVRHPHRADELFNLAVEGQREHYRTVAPLFPVQPGVAAKEQKMKYSTGYFLALVNGTFAVLLYLKEIGPEHEWISRPFSNWCARHSGHQS